MMILIVPPFSSRTAETLANSPKWFQRLYLVLFVVLCVSAVIVFSTVFPAAIWPDSSYGQLVWRVANWLLF